MASRSGELRIAPHREDGEVVVGPECRPARASLADFLFEPVGGSGDQVVTLGEEDDCRVHPELLGALARKFTAFPPQSVNERS